MRTIAVLNQKGGVGKTTCCVNIGAGLAMQNQQVLLIDLDPQSHLTDGLGIEEGRKTIYDLMKGQASFKDVRIVHSQGLNILPSDIDLASAEIELAAMIGRELKLRSAMNGIQDFDYILVDCPPSLGLLTINALSFVQEVFITIQPEYYALQGTKKLLDTIELVKQVFNHELEVTGVIITLYDSRKNLTKEVESRIRHFFGPKVFSTVIRTNVSLAEAPGYGENIFEYAPGSHGAEDYATLCQEIMDRRL
jgi:chromosome partitioning protein